MPNGPGPISYNITLSGINLVDNSPIIITPDAATVLETMYSVPHSVVPHSRYTAVVVAFTGAGPGPEEEITMQTAEEGQLHFMHILGCYEGVCLQCHIF